MANYTILTKSLIRLFTGHSFIVASGTGGKFYYSADTEKHEFTEISVDIYNECFSSELMSNIISLN